MMRATALVLGALPLARVEAVSVSVYAPPEGQIVLTDLMEVQMKLDIDESYGVLYEGGRLLQELPDKDWALAANPPCAKGYGGRNTAVAVRLQEPRSGDLSVTSFRCGGLDVTVETNVSESVWHVSDARRVAGCEDVTGDGVQVVDSFFMLNEWDMVAIRQAELAGEVDAHLLMEADRTHRGFPRDGDEFWRDAAARFTVAGAAPVIARTVRLWPPHGPNETDADIFDRANPHRLALVDALRDNWERLDLDHEDVVVFMDVDEIPNRNTVRRLRIAAECDKRRARRGLPPVLATPAALLMSHHHYALEWALPGGWAGPYAARVGDLLGVEGAPPTLGVTEGRYVAMSSPVEYEGPVRPIALYAGGNKSHFLGPGRDALDVVRSLIADAGWHLSYFPRSQTPDWPETDEPRRLETVATSIRRKLVNHGHRQFVDELDACLSPLELETSVLRSGPTLDATWRGRRTREAVPKRKIASAVGAPRASISHDCNGRVVTDKNTWRPD